MKHTALLILLLAGCFLLICAQEFAGPLSAFAGSRVQLVPLLFCIGALALPFPIALVWALGCGLLLDASQFHLVEGKPELPFGLSALYFLIMAAVCHGVRDLFLRGDWWILSALAFVATLLLPALQYLLISLQRFETGGLEWSQFTAWRLLFPAVLAALLAPVTVAFYYLVAGPWRTSHRRAKRRP